MVQMEQAVKEAEAVGVVAAVEAVVWVVMAWALLVEAEETVAVADNLVGPRRSDRLLAH